MSTTDIPASAAAILGAFAHGAAPEIEAAGLDPTQIGWEPGALAAASALYLHRSDKPVNLLNLMAHVGRRIDKDDWRPIAKIWQNGYGEVDAALAVEAVRQDYLLRESRRIAILFEQKMATEPADVRRWLPDIRSQIDSLTQLGEVYDARPSAIYQKAPPEILFRSGSEQINQMLGGGYWAPSLTFIVGISGQGKSTAFYTLACDWIISGRSLVFIDAERGVTMPMRRVLRGLSRLTNEEVRDRKGSTPERDKILWEWVRELDEYMRIYPAAYYTGAKIQQVMRSDRPTGGLIIDYLIKRDDMLPGRRDDPVGDMAYFLLEKISADMHLPVITGGQMSDTAAREFAQDVHAVPQITYGTARPYHASTLWLGVRRHPHQEDVGQFHRTKDTNDGEVDQTYTLPFDRTRWTFSFTN